MLQSGMQIFDQGIYSGLHREATGDTTVGTSHQALGSFKSDAAAASTLPYDAGSSGAPRLAGHMFDQTRYGLQQNTPPQEGDEKDSGLSAGPSSHIQTNSQDQRDDPNLTLFVQTLATISPTAQSVFPASSSPAPPTLTTEELEISPAPKIHRTFRPSAVHTAMCDLCNKKNKTVIQRCQDCNMQFCKECIRNKKVGGNHVANFDDLEWRDVGPGLKPNTGFQKGNKCAKKKSKSIATGGDNIPAGSALCDPASARVNESSSVTRKMTRASTRAATTASLRKSRARRKDTNEDDADDSGSLTDEDHLDEDAVGQDYIRHQCRVAELARERRQDQETSLVRGGSIHDAAVFDSGFGGSAQDMHNKGLRESIGSSSTQSGAEVTGMGYGGAQEGYRVHDPYHRPSGLKIQPPPHSFGMGYGYPLPAGMHPNNTQQSMNHGPPRHPGAHLAAGQYVIDPLYHRYPIFQPLAFPFAMHFGSQHYSGHQPAANPHPVNSGEVGYGTMPSNTPLQHPTHERPTVERFERSADDLAEDQKQGDAAEKAGNEESSHNAEMRDFRSEVLTAWHEDADMLGQYEVEEAGGMFSAAVMMMGMKRGMKQDDIADVFRQVTGNEMTS